MEEEEEEEEMVLINHHVLIDSCMTGKHLDRRLEQTAKQIPHVKYEGVYWTNLFVLKTRPCVVFLHYVCIKVIPFFISMYGYVLIMFLPFPNANA